MAAISTDLLRKLSRRWVSQIGSGGVADAVATTIPLSSTTNLATDTAVTLVIDRVDANGTATPTLEETIVGVVSSTNIVNALRGVEGTAQAHSAGAVVEVLVTADGYNDIVDWGLVAHDQLGTHKSGSVFTLPQINDTTADHQYVMSVCELTADRTVALPLLTGNDEFTFNAHTQTLTNKRLTSPKINEDVALTLTATNINKLVNSPQGFLINGKIVPSVASDDLTVAIKGLDGNDPSATNPVYCRIGDTVRSITAALSVTKADATNWCNAGSAELATKEIDYFVYLGYNATDGVVIGFSRIPYGNRYDSFSATAANEKYCAISTITTAAAGDAYENIGRFAATLSAGAGYTWTVPTFTTANLIQRPIYESRWLTWLPTYTGSGSMTYGTVTTTTSIYKIFGSSIHVRVSSDGTTGGSASWGVRMSTPISPVVNGNIAINVTYDGTNQNVGGVNVNTSGYIENNFNPAGGNWGLGAGRTIQFSGIYGI